MPATTDGQHDAAARVGPGPRRTSARVRVIDTVARVGITVGGIGVIVAVLGILAYLVFTAAPLLGPGRLALERTVTPSWNAPRVEDGVVDEYLGSGLFVTDAGEIVAVSLDSGDVLSRTALSTETRRRTAMSAIGENGLVALGYDDGSIQVGTLGFVTDFVDAPALPEAARDVPIGARAPIENGYVERTALGQLRRTTSQVTLPDPVALRRGSGAVVRVDVRDTASKRFVVAMREDGVTTLSEVRTISPLGGGKPRLRATETPVEFAPPAALGADAPLPMHLFITGDGASVLALWESGTLQRYTRGDPSAAEMSLAQTIELPIEGGRVSRAAMLLGGLTLVIADDQSRVWGIIPTRSADAPTPDGVTMNVAHRFAVDGSGGLAMSVRDRTFVAISRTGVTHAINMTSGKMVAAHTPPAPTPPSAAVIAPKLDAVVRVDGPDASGALHVLSFEPGHPEASWSSLFGKVWYEGEPRPAYVYQSTAGTDDAEPKMSLVPLIFGTLKATVFSMLFAVPLAVGAALYTSEMLHPRVRLAVKPVVEMMASLPSVVLGFVTAMVVAPLARDFLPALLVGFVVLPVTALAGAHMWQLLPLRITTRVRTYQHMIMVGLVLMIGIALSTISGPLFERALFSPTRADVLFLAGSTQEVSREEWPAWARERRVLSAEDGRRMHDQGLYVSQGVVVRPVGSLEDPAVAARVASERLERPDMRLWLDGVIGSARPGWLMLLMPPALVLVALLRGALLDRRLYALGLPRTGLVAGVVELGKFVVTVAASVGVAFAGAALLTRLGFDARDSLLGTFTQRNTLVVAIVMGFAIIPIIYTISEDAMSSVPGALRSAALGCGATRWQTAVTVVLPLAMSGVFSACMIGLGRAAGETMIVLMATGNTPSMDWNIFSGFRTLAANIAVEMPEAAKGETHYRVLFLAGLCLFVLTFVVNTAAELLRQRVRRRGANL
jgi:phosphate transport system permease protein